MVRCHEAAVQNELDDAVEANLTRAMRVQQHAAVVGHKRRRSNTNARAASFWPAARKKLGGIRPRTANTRTTAQRSYEGVLKHLAYEP